MKRKTNTIIPNVVRGGVAIPLGDNYFYMKGRKHKDGGIDIGKNPRTGLEVESDEIVHTSPKELKVYSSVPFLNGISPAEKLLGGENPNKVFDEQQRFKKVNNINDDGTKNGNTNKAENGTIKSNKYIRKFILPKKYSKIPFVKKYIDSFVKKFEHLSNEEIASRLYNNLYQGYNPDRPLELKQRIKKAVLNNKKETDDVVNHHIRYNAMDALFAEYLNIPKDKRRKLNYIDVLSDSEYKPTNSKDNITYRKINLLDDDTKYSIINRAINDSKNYKKYVPYGDHNHKALKIGENTTSKILENYGLGTHTIGRNVDPNKGEYVSYYDLWDMTPIGKSGGKDQSLNIGKPINIYDRIYLDDYYGVDSTPEKGNYYGGYISESHVTANKKIMGGLSRYKDYGSNKKPYPDVNKSDFAGGNRSYPIPTKADAIDALRLAGLHGRKDVRAKVLSKYPELRQKAKRGGLYTVNIGGVEHLKSTSFTGDDSIRKKCTAGAIHKKVSDDNKTTIQIPDIEVPEIEDSNITIKEDEFTPLKDNLKIKPMSIKTSKPYTTEDYIGAASNILGNIGSYFTNRRMLKNLKTPNQPIARQAAKLKTRTNINPQLDAIRENVSSNERDIEGNTASSRTALARKQRIRNIGQQQTNQLYGTKENTETQLINQDKLNQQEVTNKNIEDYNKYQDSVTAFKNAVDEKKSENVVNLISGINNSMQDLISRREKRDADIQTRLAMVAAHPNVNPRILRDLGIKGITDKDIIRWDKAFGRKKTDK